MAKKSKKKAAAAESAAAKDAAKATASGAPADDAAADATAAPTPDTAEEGSWEQLLQAAQQEAANHHENYLRMAAELENLRRRSEKKIADAHQFALTDFALAVGEVRDCLEAALSASTAEAEKMREGVELTLRKLAAAMDARHILPIQPDIGAAFDPSIHMAIGQAPATPQAPPDTVAVVVQAGYMLNGRVIRAATVMVATDTTADNATAKK